MDIWSVIRRVASILEVEDGIDCQYQDCRSSIHLELCVPYTSTRRELEYDRDRRWSTILSTDIEMIMVGTLTEYASNNLTILGQEKMTVGLSDYLNSGYE